jgi:hypothetical protein
VLKGKNGDVIDFRSGFRHVSSTHLGTDRQTSGSGQLPHTLWLRSSRRVLRIKACPVWILEADERGSLPSRSVGDHIRGNPGTLPDGQPASFTRKRGDHRGPDHPRHPDDLFRSGFCSVSNPGR